MKNLQRDRAKEIKKCMKRLFVMLTNAVTHGGLAPEAAPGASHLLETAVRLDKLHVARVAEVRNYVATLARVNIAWVVSARSWNTSRAAC